MAVPAGREACPIHTALSVPSGRPFLAPDFNPGWRATTIRFAPCPPSPPPPSWEAIFSFSWSSRRPPGWRAGWRSRGFLSETARSGWPCRWRSGWRCSGCCCWGWGSWGCWRGVRSSCCWWWIHLAGLGAWQEELGRIWALLADRRRRAAAVGLIAVSAPFFLLALYPPTAFDETLYHLPFAREFVRTGGVPFLPDLRFPVFPQLAEILVRRRPGSDRPGRGHPSGAVAGDGHDRGAPGRLGAARLHAGRRMDGGGPVPRAIRSSSIWR